MLPSSLSSPALYAHTHTTTPSRFGGWQTSYESPSSARSISRPPRSSLAEERAERPTWESGWSAAAQLERQKAKNFGVAVTSLPPTFLHPIFLQIGN